MSGGYVALSSEVVHTPSFDSVFTAHYPYVSRLARSLLGDAQDAEDVAQEVFLRVYKSLSSYDPERASMSTWLTKLTVNACRTHRRRNFLHYLWKSMQHSDDSADDAPEPADLSLLGAPEDHALQNELRRAVRAVIDKLKPAHRTVLVLHHYMDLSCSEIASILECPEGTVYSRLHYARRVVQSQMELHMQRLNSEAEI